MASFNRNISNRDQDPPSWHGQPYQASSRNKLAWPALTRELLAGTKNTQTVAGMASPHILVGMASLNSNVFGRSQEQSIAGMASLNRRVFSRHQDPLAGMASLNKRVIGRGQEYADDSWHG